MRRKSRWGLAFLVMITGCGGTSGEGSDRRAEVERFIRSDLDKQIRTAGETGRVTSVTCAAESDTKFDCIVKASDGTSASADATADSQGNIVYKVEAGSPIAQLAEPEPTEEAQEPPADAETAEDGDQSVAIAELLELEGFEAEPGGPSEPPGTGEAVVTLGEGQGTVYAYATAEDARAEAKPLEQVEAESPEQAEVAVEGRYVVVGTIEEPATLSVTRFNKLVDAVATLDDE